MYNIWMIKLKCAICGDKQKVKVLYRQNFDSKDFTSERFSARRAPDGKHYRFLRCENCGLIFSTPIIEVSRINKLYQDSVFIYEVESEYLKKTYGKLLEELIFYSRVKPNTIRLLEIGCGNGFFLERAREIGVKEFYGIEPSLQAVNQSSALVRKRIKTDILKPRLFKTKSFDIVCCFHTLDHIANPNQFLKIAFSYLKKGGRVVFVVHDTDGLSVKLFGERSAIFDIEHIYLFNRSNIAKIFSINGFRVDKVDDLKNTYPLKYWFKMVPLPKVVKKVLSFVLEKSFLGNLALSVKPGNIVILATKS